MKRLLWLAAALLCSALNSFASSTLPMTAGEQLAQAAAVFRGEVAGQECFRGDDGLIYTRTSLRVLEGIKGTLPGVVATVHRGGAVGAAREFFGNAPLFAAGAEYLVFVTRGADGRLLCPQGEASAVKLIRVNGKLSPEQTRWLNYLRTEVAGQGGGENVTDQIGSATSSLVSGLLVDGAGISSRFLSPDRGEPISVLIDADNLPTGITLTQATNAVVQALNAWTAVTKLKFRIEGLQSFGAGADAISTADEKLRIQLHDNYNRINSAGTLGIGGRGSLSSPAGTWDLGGAVGTNEFYKTAYGYVVLERTNVTMQNLASFTEVLCHEVGHALSMAHSSGISPEPNNVLFQSIMYFQIHADGRGATLGAYDPPVIQQAYPSNNTPPYTYPRVLDVTTASPQPNVVGINSVDLRGYDLQGGALTLLTNNATVNNGIFSRVGSTIKFAANAAFSDSARVDPATTSFYDRIVARYSDGTNASPYVSVRVVSFNFDSLPAGASDGIPNTWMTSYFGNANPTVGVNHGAAQDADGDKVSNLNEYIAGMVPTNAASAQAITLFNKTNLQFQAKAYELYELLTTANLTNPIVNWVRAVNPVLPTNSVGVFTGFTNTAMQQFFRIEKVP
jgi:hypothetical protein